MTRENLPTRCYPELPDFQKKAVRVVIEFSSALEDASKLIDRDDVEDAEREAANEMISHVEALMGDAYYWGASVALGLMGMAEAIRRTHLGYRTTRYVQYPAPPIVFDDEDEAVPSPGLGQEGKVVP